MLPAFMAASAAMLGTRYRVEVKPGYTEPMVIWVGSVGAASTLKTPVAQQVLRPLLKQTMRMQLAYKEKLRQYKALPRRKRRAARFAAKACGR